MPSPGEESLKHAVPSKLLHDMRTPLNHIIGYSELIVELTEETGQSELVPYLEKVRAAGHSLISLISDNFRGVRPDATAEGASDPEPLMGGIPALAGSDPVPGSGWGSVLVVDDVEDNRHILGERLARQGYDVLTAPSGEQALALLGTEKVELVLLDVSMPGLDGYEVLRRLKADERLRHLPVIMISALGDLDSVARCIEMGADDYLPKPFNPTILQARIRASLEKKRARDREMLLFEELQENHRRLQELEHARGNLTGIVEELRAPLAAVISEMRTLLAAGELPEPLCDNVGVAAADGQRVLGMIDELLDR